VQPAVFIFILFILISCEFFQAAHTVYGYGHAKGFTGYKDEEDEEDKSLLFLL
jgi:hypothetical protein